FNPSGTALLLLGTKTHGQGHDTAFKQILHEKLGIDPADVQYVDGDTDAVAFGMGSNGSRSMVVGGSAVVRASDKIIAKGTKIAAHLLEAAEADIAFGDNKFTVVGTDRAVALKEVAKASFQPARLPKGMEPGLYENATYQPSRHVSQFLPRRRGRDRSRHRHGGAGVLSRRGRRRHRDQSPDAERPD